MASTASAHRWRDLYRRNERRIAALWIGGVLVLFAGMAVEPVRSRALSVLQRLASFYDARWDRRLDDGRRLVEAKRFDDAATYLERLDRDFPARTSRQARDKEREYLLRLLAQSYEAGEHKTKAIATWQRLVAFDSINYRNHFEYGQAAERLLSGWSVAPEARDGYARALQLFPTHLPSLRGYIAYYNDRSEWREITAAYRSYLDAFLLEEVRLRVGDSVRAMNVLVDGRPHDIELAWSLPAGWRGDLMVGSVAYPLVIEQVTVLPHVRVGAAAPREARAVSLEAVRAQAMRRAGAGWLPDDSSGMLRVPVEAGADGIARLTVRVRMFKLMDAPLWQQIAKCYRNLVDSTGLADATTRSVSYPSASAADAALGRLGWSTEGQYRPGVK